MNARAANVGDGVFVCRNVIGDGGLGEGVFRVSFSPEGDAGLSTKKGRMEELPLERVVAVGMVWSPCVQCHAMSMLR